jgi:DnaJ family protein A protein 2
MSENINYYNELGLDKTASLTDIKRAYRTLAMQHHPDKGGDAEKFKKVCQSYEILSDPEKRRNYDTFGHVETNNSGVDFSKDVFSMFFNGGFRDMFTGSKAPTKGQSIVHTLEITLEELYNGKTIILSCNKKIICNKCDGKGGHTVIRCQTCNGSGQCFKQVQLGPFVMQQMISKCTDCDKGNRIDPGTICDKCNGNKVVPETEVINVVIKPGTIDCSKVVLECKADEYPETVPGDIVLVIKEKKHSIFTREGVNLKMEKTLNIKQSLCGFNFNITHLDGRSVFIKKDGVTGYNYIQTIEKHGMNESGSLIINYKIQFPESLTEKQQTIINEHF